jgi:hypothetical protein
MVQNIGGENRRRLALRISVIARAAALAIDAIFNSPRKFARAPREAVAPYQKPAMMSPI